MADPQAELEALRKEREEKVRQIDEKKKQVEDLRRRRAQRMAQQGERPAADDNNKSLDALVAEILGGGVMEASVIQKIAPKPEQDEKARAEAGKRRARLQEEYKLAVVSLEPEEQEVYERGAQTDLSGEIKSDSKGDTAAVDGALVQPKSVVQQVSKKAEQAKQRLVRPDAADDNKPGIRVIRAQAAPAGEEKEEEKQEEVKEMTQEERETVVQRPDFKAFFSRATLLVERTLGAQEWDIATDWGTKGSKDAGAETAAKDVMKHMEEFTEEKWSRMRPVTDVRFSPHKKEHFLAAYHLRKGAAATDSDGCMLVWNLAMKTRPELAFSSPSPVLCADFHEFDEAVFYGGTYAGGIMLWDARARSGPVLRTPLSAKGHTHPVTALQQVGTQNATNLVTASNDGRLCVWSLAMLNLPQETIDLKNETRNKRDLAVMSLSFPENETNTLYVGAEDGSICQVQLHGSKVGVTEVYDGHDGPVAGLDMHPHQADSNQSGEAFNVDVGVSCSYDWTVKVWMVKQFQQPVLSLDAYEDYVYDVKWHTHHPGVFTAIDGEGHVDLWNLNQNIESPVVRCENPNSRRIAMNRCTWSSDGRRLAAGDSEGTVSVFGVHESIYHPRTADFVQFNERARSFQPIVSRSRDTGYDLGRYAPALGRAGLDLGSSR